MGVIVLSLSMLPDLSSAWPVSVMGFFAAVILASFCTIGSGIAITITKDEDINRGRPDHVGDSNTAWVMGIMAALGQVIFAFGIHAVMPDIQASLHDHNTTDAHGDMKKAINGAYKLAFPIYILSGLLGYAAFGANVEDDLLLSLNNYFPAPAMWFVWVFVVIKVGTEAAIFNQAVFTLLRDITGLTIESDHVDHHPKNKFLDIVMRTLWVIVASLIAMFVPYVSIILFYNRTSSVAAVETATVAARARTRTRTRAIALPN